MTDKYAGQEGPVHETATLTEVIKRLTRIEALLHGNEDELRPMIPGTIELDGDDDIDEQMVNFKDALRIALTAMVDQGLIEGFELDEN